MATIDSMGEGIGLDSASWSSGDDGLSKVKKIM